VQGVSKLEDEAKFRNVSVLGLEKSVWLDHGEIDLSLLSEDILRGDVSLYFHYWIAKNFEISF
jgi:hypothetical protein